MCSFIINKVCQARWWGGGDGGGGLRIALGRRSVVTLNTLLKIQLDACNPREGLLRNLNKERKLDLHDLGVGAVSFIHVPCFGFAR